MTKIFASVFFSFLIFQLGCSTQSSISGKKEIHAVPAKPKVVSPIGWADSVLQHLTLEEKVAQLVVVWTEGKYFPRESDEWRELERLTTERKLGGFVFSIGDVYEYAVEINKLQGLADVPLLIASDFEYGTGMRVRNAMTLPHAMAIGATRDRSLAYEAGKFTAEEARALGVEQNYAPVLDVNNNPKNPVINTRSFGDNVHLVSDMTAAFVKGTQDGGVIATVKHFPGHGDSDIDTHLALPILRFSKTEFDSVELAPFKHAFAGGAMSVMVGHISVPVFDSAEGIPATVSPNITTTLLKDELGFKGLVVTDAMRMHGVASTYAPGEAVVDAIKAGSDLVLMPVNVDVAIDAIVKAVKNGEIPESRIDASVRKLLKYKQWAGLDKNRFVDIDNVYNVVGSEEHERLAREIARKSITVLGNKGGILPLSETGTERMLDISFSDVEDPSVGRTLQYELRSRRDHVEFARIDPRSNKLDYQAVLDKASRADLILCQLHFYTRSGEMTGFIPKMQSELINTLIALNKPVLGISFGNPYVVMDFPKIGTYVCAYGGSDESVRAAAQVLFAEAPAAGKLPVTIPGVYDYGDGVTYQQRVLRRGEPEDVGFDPDKLCKVDDIVEKAIQDSAFPGATLLVAKDGVVVWNKAYGTYDYSEKSQLVDVNSMYDLASVTKVIATTSAVMRLYDEEKLKLDDPVIKYIPQFGQNGKEHITLYNLLVHDSGLPAFIRFYYFCNDPQCLLDSLYAAKLVYKTGDSSIYSDLGLITMGKVIEKITGTTLDRYVDSVFFKPLGMTSTMYNPPASLIPRIAPTEVDNYWKKTGVAVRGRVHDENAATLGGVSGHAGLFSTTSDLAVLLQMELNGGTYGGVRYIKEATLKKFRARQSSLSTRGIGWDTKNPGHSWAGKLMSDSTFLHTGFTGTSVAVDPTRNLIIVFLTNRVNPTRNNYKIAEVRPVLHDAIVSALKEKR
ncbi:MAG: serine hydrolase [Bacteroidota bacterium]|nr:serine hydrolase [Bacteroidota bacterium]